MHYFYAHKRVEDGIIVVMYCPTKEMISNFLSKPLQGSLFQTHMGISTTVDIKYKLAYAKEKALRSKAASDHLSV